MAGPAFGRMLTSSLGVPIVPAGIPFGMDSRVYFVAPYRTTENGASDGNDALR